MPNWAPLVPIVVLAILVPFALWVRWQVRKINREEGPLGLQRRSQDDETAP
jgi:hypothetical protein